MDTLIIDAAKYAIVLSAAGAALFWLLLAREKKVGFIVRAVIAAVIALALAKLVGHFFYDTRPFITQHFSPLIPHAGDNGFPSDHTLLAAFLAFLVLSYSWRWGTFMVLIAVGVGAARVAAGIHSPLDIVGSFVFAAAGLALAMPLAAWFMKLTTSKTSDETLAP